MATYDWKATPRIAAPTFNPNAGLAMATSSFGNISRQLQAEEEAASLAGHRAAQLAQEERKQLFAEGAPERLITEEQRQQELAAGKAQTALNIGRETSALGEKAFYADPKVQQILDADPKYQALDDEGKAAYRAKFRQQSPGIFTTPANFAREMRTSLAASGQYGLDEINQITKAEVARRWPTSDPDIISKLLDTGKGGATTNIYAGEQRKGAAGSFKMFPTSQAAWDEARDQLKQNYDMDERPSTIFGMPVDVGKTDMTVQDVDSLMSAMKLQGVESPTAAIDAIRLNMNPDGTAKMEMRKPSAKTLETLVDMAKQAERTEKQEQLYSSRTGQGVDGASVNAQTALKARSDYNQALLSKLSPRAATQDEILTSFLKGLGSTYKKTTGSTAVDKGPLLEPQDDKPVAAPDTAKGKSDRKPLLSGKTPTITPRIMPNNNDQQKELKQSDLKRKTVDFEDFEMSDYFS